MESLLRKELQELKTKIKVLFKAHCGPQLFTMVFHLLEQLCEDLLVIILMQILYASHYFYLNIFWSANTGNPGWQEQLGWRTFGIPWSRLWKLKAKKKLETLMHRRQQKEAHSDPAPGWLGFSRGWCDTALEELLQIVAVPTGCCSFQGSLVLKPLQRHVLSDSFITFYRSHTKPLHGSGCTNRRIQISVTGVRGG